MPPSGQTPAAIHILFGMAKRLPSTGFPRLRPDETERLLLSHGIAPTQQRVEIAAILLACPQHLSAEELLSMANHGHSAVSKATVYNTLGLFADKGLVREVVVDPTKVFYDSNTGKHHHFYDADKGTLTDIEEGRISVGQLPPLPEGTELESVEVIVRLRSSKPQYP